MKIDLMSFYYQLIHLFKRISQQKNLIFELTRQELTVRYAGQILGTVWVIGHPLILISIYTFIFTFIFPAKYSSGDISTATTAIYILSGIIPWVHISEYMNKSTHCISDHSRLVKNLIFPVEVLPIKSALSTLFSQVIATLFFIIILFVQTGALPGMLLLLPFVFLLQFIFMVSLGMFFGSLGVFIKDIKDVVQVLTTAGLFLAPILYTLSDAEKVWAPFRYILYANPISHFVWVYHDVFYHGAMAHPYSWLIIISLSLLFFLLSSFIFLKFKMFFSEQL